LAGETEVLGGNLPQRHFVHHKIPHDQTRARTRGRSGGKPATNRLSYGATVYHTLMIMLLFFYIYIRRPGLSDNEIKIVILTGFAILCAGDTYNLVAFPVHHMSNFVSKKYPIIKLLERTGRRINSSLTILVTLSEGKGLVPICGH
jgi:hypothetical protein